MEGWKEVDNFPSKVPGEAESNTDGSEIRSSNPVLQERSQHEEHNVLADGNKNSDMAALLLSSTELPSWAMRQTASVPPNSHRIAECQGCMKEGHGAPHTCDMKDDIPLRFSDVPPSVYPIPSNRHSMVPPMMMNPYAPAWSESHEVGPPSWRHPPLPPWRQDQNSYHSRPGYQKHYYDDYEDEYIRHYPLDAYARHCMREGNRGPSPHEAYIPHANYNHSYGAMHDPAFLRSRHMEEHPPPPSHFHQYSTRKYPPIPLSGQSLAGSEWQSRSLQNCSQYEPPHVSTDAFVDRINSRGDWSQHEMEQSILTNEATSHPDLSSLSQSTMYTTKTQSDGFGVRPENYQSLIQTKSPAGDPNAKAAPVSETKTSSEKEVVSSAESKTNFSENNRQVPPADGQKPHVISPLTSSNNNNKDFTSNNDSANSRAAVNETLKSHEKESSMKTESTDSTILGEVMKEETSPPYTRKSPCAFTIDISEVGSSADESFGAPKLPANLAKRVAKFPRRLTPKEDKSEMAQQASLTVVQQKKKSSSHSNKQLADDKDRKSTKAKHLQHISINNTEDDDCDDDRSETYQDRLQWSKPMTWTKVEVNSQKNDHYFKSSEPGLRGTSATTSRVKSTTMRSDDGQMGKLNKSSEFERPSIHRDNPSISARKYASFGHKSPNYPEQISHRVSFETEDDTSSELSDTETYTVCTSEQDSAVTAAREKIGEVFRVGMKDELSETEPDDNPELEDLIDLTTAVEVCERKPEDASKQSQNDPGLDLQDSDDVICLTYDSNKDSVGDRKSKHDTEINLASSFPMSSNKNTSLSKRLLPRIPGKDDLADSASSLVFEAADTRSDAGDSDKGFFEVLSSEAPKIQLTGKKKAGQREINSSISGAYQELHTDGEFEVIADAPLVGEDAGLTKENSPNDNTVDFYKKNKVLKNSFNTRDSDSFSQPEDEELKKIFYDAPSPGRMVRATVTDKYECVSDHKPKLHSTTGKLQSMPRFYDTVLPDETSLNHSQKPLVCNSATTSKRQTIVNRTNNQERSPSSNEGFVPLTFGRSSVRSEGRKLPGSPTKPMSNTKSEFISRGRLGSGGRGQLRETDNEGVHSNGAGFSLSQPSTPRLAHRMGSTQSQRYTENSLESRPPSSGSRQKTIVSKTVSHGSAIAVEPATSSRASHVRQRSLSRPLFSRGDPQISLSRPPLPKDDPQRPLTKPPSSRGDPQITLSKPYLSRDDPTRQQLNFLKQSGIDSSDTAASMLLNRSKPHKAFKGQRKGETPLPEKATSLDNEARMKRSKSVSTGLRSRTSDVENPKLQAYHERMKYDPRKAIQDSKKHRLSASSRSDDTDASSYEELQNHHSTRHHPESMSHSDRHSRKTSDYQPRSSMRSGTRPRSARTRMPSNERLNQSTSSDVDVAYDVRSTTIPSIQNLSEDIQQLLDKIKQDKTRTTQVTSLSANRDTSSSVDDPQLNELRKTLRKVKQVLQSKFHS